MKQCLKVLIFLSTLSVAPTQLKAQTNLKKIDICIPIYREELIINQLLLADSKKYFEKHGIKANFIFSKFSANPMSVSFSKNFPTSAEESKFINKSFFNKIGLNDFTNMDSKCDFITTNAETFIYQPKLINQFKPLRMTAYGDTYDTHLVVLKSSPIKNLKDLKGKKVRVGFTSSVMALEEILSKEGMNIGDLDLVLNMHPTKIHEALKNNTIAAAISYFPTMHELLASGDVRILKKDIYLNHLKTPAPQSMVFVSAKFAAKSPEIVSAFELAMTDSEAFGNSNPSQLARIFKSSTSQLQFSKWEVSDSNLEKINEIYPKVKSIDFKNEKLLFNGKSMTAFEIFENYNKKLVNLHYAKEMVDLSVWKNSSL